MSKIVKLTEKDIRNAVAKIMKEQIDSDHFGNDGGLKPYPAKQEPEFTPTNDNGVPEERVRVEYGTHPQLIDAKVSVDKNLRQALFSMKRLIAMSGVNPDSNGMIGDIEKVIGKFDSLYGPPKKKEEKK